MRTHENGHPTTTHDAPRTRGRRVVHEGVLAGTLAAALLVVAVAELAFSGFVALLGETSLAVAETTSRLALGNVLGWLLVGGWMWRAHPELRREFADAMRGTESAPVG